MNKLILCSMLAVGLCCARENCEFLNIEEKQYSTISVYNFRCTGIKGYDYVEHEIHINYNKYLSAVYSSYYIEETERKFETFEYTTNEKKNGDTEDIGLHCISLYDEFHIEMKGNCYTTSYESVERTILNKWNRLKKTINK